MTVKFEVGQTYNVDREYGEVITVLRRTEKSIWVSVDSGTEERRKIKTQGTTECFMLNTFTVIFAKPDNLNGCMTETIIEEQTDIEYKIKGAKVVFMPVSDAGEAIMPELLKHEVMSWHISSIKSQLKTAGYIIKKASSKKVSNKINQDDLNLLKELGIEI
jgi:hypothetical protein